MLRFPRVLSPVPLGLVLAALLLLVTPVPAMGDVVRLRTGEVVKGRPLVARSDERLLVIEDFLSGATRTLSWQVVDAEDRDRLLREWKWTNEALDAVEGHRITIRLQDGTRDDVRGLIVREDDLHYVLLRDGKEIEIRKAMVVKVTSEAMDPRDIWSPDQLVERFLAKLAAEPGVDLTNPTPALLFRIAEHAREVGAFEVARRYYAQCAGNVAARRLAEMEAILDDRAAVAALRRIGMALRTKSFRKARALLASFAREHPDVGEPIRRRLAATTRELGVERAKHFQLQAKLQFPKLVLKLIEAKVRETDTGLGEVTNWTHRALPDRAFETLAEALARWDDVTPAEARAFWHARRKSGWRTATYGAGTFIVEPARKQPTRRSGAAASVKIPKPPNRDPWWQKADSRMRTSWVMAFFAENAGLFEVSETPKYTLCIRCNGTGRESLRLSTGGTLSYPCTRCGGTQRDKRVRFR